MSLVDQLSYFRLLPTAITCTRYYNIGVYDITGKNRCRDREFNATNLRLKCISTHFSNVHIITSTREQPKSRFYLHTHYYIVLNYLGTFDDVILKYDELKRW